MRVYMVTPVLRQQLSREIREKSRPLEPITGDTSADLHRLPGIRCVAFDVYGTLLVSAAGEISTATGASRDAGPFALMTDVLRLPRTLTASVEETYYQTIDTHHQRARARGTQHPEVDIRAVWREVIGRFESPVPLQSELVALSYELAANPVWPMPGALTLLQSLAHRGIRVALVSNAQFYTPLILEELLGESLESLHIRPCIWSYEIGEAKPSPAPFRSLIDALASEQISPGETLYLGNDMLNDIVTAQDQGLRAVLFAGDRRSLRLRCDRPEIRTRAPDAVITDLQQLPAVIGSE
ncbi:MAG: HAD family hydrolase [Alkalispirochaeta sp.]